MTNAPLSLHQLQNLIKRDASSYREEFNLQLRHFDTQLAIFQLKTRYKSKNIR